MDEAELTTGYCIHCGDRGKGRYLWPINDREEAIDQHVRCRWPSRASQDSAEPEVAPS